MCCCYRGGSATSGGKSPGTGRALFYVAMAWQHIWERRYRVDDQILDELRRALEAGGERSRTLRFLRPERTQCFMADNLGVALAWNGDLDQARQAQERP